MYSSWTEVNSYILVWMLDYLMFTDAKCTCVSFLHASENIVSETDSDSWWTYVHSPISVYTLSQLQ